MHKDNHDILRLLLVHQQIETIKNLFKLFVNDKRKRLFLAFFGGFWCNFINVFIHQCWQQQRKKETRAKRRGIQGRPRNQFDRTKVEKVGAFFAGNC